MFRLLLRLFGYFLVGHLAAAGEAGRIRGENGEISLTVAVPLTNDGVLVPDPGWMQMASALLAIDHFNEKNPSVVPQLAELSDCPIKIVNITVIDTGTNSHRAMKSLFQKALIAGAEVDAIAGPYNEQPALELSTLATGMEAPMVAFRGLDHNLVLPDKHPFYSQVNPDVYGEIEFLAEFLRHTNRTDYIAILYTNEDSMLQRTEMLQIVLKEKLNCDQVKAYSYLSIGKTPEGEERGIHEAVKMIAQTGYRTVVLLTTTPDLDIPTVGAAALEYGLDQGKHFWIIPGGLDPTGTPGRDSALSTYGRQPEGGFLRGAAYLYIFEGFNINPEDPFARAMERQNASFVQRLRDLNPIANYSGKVFCNPNNVAKEDSSIVSMQWCEPTDDFFQTRPHLSERVSFAYDATMAIGIGACLAISSKNNTTSMTGEEHVDGIQSADFMGASGRVKFRNRPGTPGSRDSLSVYYGVLNLLPYGADGPETVPTSFLYPGTQEWTEIQPYVYSDGTTSPPRLLRSVPEQNYLDPAVRAVGLTLMSIALFVVSASVVWVGANRTHRVVVAAQPPFLYVLCLGSALSALVILTQSFDESYGWDEEMLDSACVATPWLIYMGILVTYSALFSKLWRVNKVLQFKRARINMRQVVWPALLLLQSAVVILSVWTATGDFGWVREVIDEVSGETIGHCTGTDSMVFLAPVAALCAISTMLTCIMAWQTSDVDDMYSESKWIFSLVLVQMQVMVVGAPVVTILQTLSTNGRYIGLSLIVWTYPMSTMGLIMAPKMLALYRERVGLNERSTRGSAGGTRVTGVAITPHVQSHRVSITVAGSSTGAAGLGDSHPGAVSPRVHMVTIK